MILNHYEEGINAMREEVEGKSTEPIHQPSDEERWKELVDEYSHRDYHLQTEFGTIDMSDDAMKDVYNGENLSYEEYLQALFNSRNARGIVKLGVISKVRLADLIKRRARSFSIAFIYPADLWMEIVMKEKKTTSGCLLSLLLIIRRVTAYPLEERFIVI